MRAGPLSDPNVISLLNQYFVPVYTSNEDYGDKGTAPAAEKKERDRIWHDANAANLSSGTVHVYLLEPGTNRVLDSSHVAEAAQTKKLVPMLERTIARLKLKPGDPVVAPRSQSSSPKVPKDSLVLHLVARGDREGSWREFPGENWLVLEKADWSRFLPAEGAKADTSWQIDNETAAKLLTYFYPQAENNNVRSIKVDEQTLQATLIEQEGADGRIRLEGAFKMRHSFYPGRKDYQPITGKVSGYVDVDLAKREITRFALATEKATYGKEGFSVGVQTPP
ncbi:MAG: hypothetical protein WD176_07260 [Pirellulales bacterium]